MKDTKRESITSPNGWMRLLFSLREEELMLEEKHDLRHLVETSQEAKQVYQLLQSFLHMFCARQQELLNGWMKEARACGIKELGSFVAGVERDYDAVLAGLIYH